MIVKITSTDSIGEIEKDELDKTQYDLSISGHFNGFIDKIKALTLDRKEFHIFEIKEHEIYFHNLSH